MLNKDDINNSFEYVENFSKNELLPNEGTQEEKEMDSLFTDKFDLNNDIVNELKILINSGHFNVKDINDNFIEVLKKYNQGIVTDYLKKLSSKPNEQNSSKNVIDLISSLSSSPICNSDESQKNKQLNSSDPAAIEKELRDTVSDANQNINIIRGPDENALQEILDRTGYSHSITSGQRKFGGPPPDWDGPPPSIGSEIYVGKIPKDIYEDKLIPLFEDCGKIWDFRLMLDPITGLSKGFAFLQFVDKESAQAAVKKLNNYEIRPGKALKLNISIPNLRIFVGNIPKSKSKEEIFAEFSKLTEGLMNVIVYATPGEKRKNRGFCFLEYQTHLAASVAKKRLAMSSSNGGTTKPRVWNCDIIVEWADVQDEPNEEIMGKVKVLYVRNLALSVTEPDLREAFEKWGSVEHVKKLKDYAFVHFTERDDALKAMQEMQGCRELPGGSGIPIEISLAKPPSEKRLQEKKFRELERKTTLAFYPNGLNYAASLGFPPHQAGLMNGLNPHLSLYGSPNGINGLNPNLMSLNARYINTNGYSQFVMDNVGPHFGGAGLRGTGISYYPPKVIEADYEYDLYNAPYHPTSYYPSSPGVNQANGQMLEYQQNLAANGPLQHHPGSGGGYAIYPFKPPYHAIPFNGAQQQALGRPTHPQEQSSHPQAAYARSNINLNPPPPYNHNSNLNRSTGNNRPPLLSHFQPLLPATSQPVYGNGQRRSGANYQHNNHNGFVRHHKNLQETYAT